MLDSKNVERYELTGKRDIEDIISRHFPQYKSQSREIKYDSIFANIKPLPSSAIVTTPSKNAIEMTLHETDEENFNRICGNFKLEIKNDGSLVVSKKNFADEWEIVDTIKPF